MAPTGVYGLQVRGLASRRLVPADAAWPAVLIAQTRSEGPERRPPDPAVGRLRLELEGGSVAWLDAASGTAELIGAVPWSDETLVHPFLASVGAAFAFAHGRESLHAGAFLGPRGAWGVLGAKGAGKSSLLAALHRRGVPILADDLLVCDGTQVYAGPRCLDVEAGTAVTLGLEAGLQVRSTKRRFDLGPVPPVTPLSGWVLLDWGDGVCVEPLSGAERVKRIGAQRMMRVAPTDPEHLLALASLPAWRLVRPRDIARMTEVCDALLAVTGRGATPGVTARRGPPAGTAG